MADVFWVKLYIDCFKKKKLMYVEDLPRGDTILKIWFKILCLAGECNAGGFLMVTDNIPYTEETLIATLTRKPLNETYDFLKETLVTLQALHMLEIIENKFYITNWEDYQNVDKMDKIRENTRLRVKNHRINKKCNEKSVTSNTDVTLRNALPSNSNSISNSISNNSNKEDIKILESNSSFTPIRALELYKEYSNSYYKKEYPDGHENSDGKSVYKSGKDFFEAVDDEQNPLTEKSLIELFIQAEQREWLKTQSKFLVTMGWLIKNRDRIIAGEFGAVFKEEKKKSSFDNYPQRTYEKKDLEGLYDDIEKMDKL